MAHDDLSDLVFWPTREEELAERTRGKQRRSNSRDRGDRTRGGGGSGDGDKNDGGSGKNGMGGNRHHSRIVTAVVEAGEARRVLVVAQCAGEVATLVVATEAVAAALAEAKEGGGTAQEDVQRATARQPPPARLRPQARTTAR